MGIQDTKFFSLNSWKRMSAVRYRFCFAPIHSVSFIERDLFMYVRLLFCMVDFIFVRSANKEYLICR